MKLKRKCEYVLAKDDDYELVLISEYNLLADYISWFVALVVTIGFFYLYSSIVCPDMLNYIITFLSDLVCSIN